VNAVQLCWKEDALAIRIAAIAHGIGSIKMRQWRFEHNPYFEEWAEWTPKFFTLQQNSPQAEARNTIS
jgi:hypothetical protein